MITFYLVAPPVFIILGSFIYIRVFQWEWAICNPELAAGFIASSVLVAGLFSALWTLYSMRRSRMADLAMRILELWNTDPILEAKALHHEIKDIKKQDFCQTIESCRQQDPKQYYLLRTILVLLEFTGWLARKNCMSTKWLDDLLPVEEYFDDWENYIKGMQLRQGILEEDEEISDKTNAYFGNFVWLVNKIKKLQR